MKTISLLLGVALASLLSAQTTNISVSNTTLQTGVKRMGINLGGEDFYDSLQLTKNLTSLNPGFNPVIFRSVLPCGAGSTTSCTPDYPARTGNFGATNGFWPTGTPVSVIYGSANGCTTTVTSYISGVFTFASPCSIALNSTSWIVVGPASFPGTTVMLATNNGWFTQTGAGTVTAEQSDLPTGLSTSQQAVQLYAPTSGDAAQISFKFDSSAGRSFVKLNGTYQISFKAKAVSGTGRVAVSFDRNGTSYLANTITATSSWAPYTATFTATETTFPCTAGANCIAETVLGTSGADTVRIDDVQTVQCSTATTGGCVVDTANPTVFRDEVVSTLKSLQPGTLRYWGFQAGDTLDNMLIDQFGRAPSDWFDYLSAPYGYKANPIDYGLTDFLQLAQVVGGSVEPYIVVPITFSTAEASNLIDYLAGGSTTTYGAKRIAQGFATPWTSVFSKIHLEFGNEAWNNGTFPGGAIADPVAYGQRANVIFATMRANSNYVAGSFDLVLNGWFGVANNLQTVQNNCSNNDSIEVAPYMMEGPTDDSSAANIWNPTLIEPQAFYTGCPGVSSYCVLDDASQNFTYINGPSGVGNYFGGSMYLDLMAEKYSAYPKPVNIYEENFTTYGGTFTQADHNHYESAIGAGLAVVEEMLLGVQNGIVNQNLFQLGQISQPATNGPTVFMWGCTIDMGGTTNLMRPDCLAIKALNTALAPGSTMLTTTQTNTPTLTLPLTNFVQMTSAALVQSFAFYKGSGAYGLVLLNTDIANPHAVTFSGTNAPPGTGIPITQTVLTSTNIGDTNEGGNVVAPVTTTLTSFNPSTGITLPPFSETVLTYSVATMTVLPTSESYGYVATGSTSSAQAVTVYNYTGATVSLTGNTVTGTNASDFAISATTCGSTLAAGANCTVSATFTPGALGARSATLNIANSFTSGALAIPLSGTGIASGSNATLSGTTLSFSAQLVGTSSGSQAISVTNNGSATLTISSISLSGTNAGDFSQTNTCGSSLTVSSTCSIAILFTPTAGGTRTATLSLADNATGSPQTVAITAVGTALPSGIIFNVTPLSFGSVTIGSSSASETTTLYNGGTTTPTVSSYALTGPNAADFSYVVSACTAAGITPFVFPAFGGCNFTVTFTPTGSGTRTAYITITDTASDSPQTLLLTGTAPGIVGGSYLSGKSSIFGTIK